MACRPHGYIVPLFAAPSGSPRTVLPLPNLQRFHWQAYHVGSTSFLSQQNCASPNLMQVLQKSMTFRSPLRQMIEMKCMSIYINLKKSLPFVQLSNDTNSCMKKTMLDSLLVRPYLRRNFVRVMPLGSIHHPFKNLTSRTGYLKECQLVFGKCQSEAVSQYLLQVILLLASSPMY